MDNLLSRMLTFPPHPPPQIPLSDQQYDEGIKAQIEIMKKMTEKNLLQSTSGAHIAAAQNGDKNIDLEELWGKVTGYLCSFDGRQIRYMGKELNRIMDATAKLARQTRQPEAAIQPIREAILRVDPSGSVLTSTHLFLVKLALETRQYESVVEVLDKHILYLPARESISYTKFICDVGLASSSYVTTLSGLTAKLSALEVLEYFFYSGMVYIGLQRWEAAFEMLENAVTYPSRDLGVSLPMVEAYKKWLLVGLLLEGKVVHLPKTTSHHAARVYHTIAKPYEAVASIFETGSASRLKSEIEHGQQIWTEDGNTGLMLCVLSTYQKSQIRNLANVYSKIGVQEVNSLTTSAETGAKLPSAQKAEELIQSMIGESTLHGNMIRDQAGQTVLTFAPFGPQLSEAQIQKELVATTRHIQNLAAQIKTTDRILTHDKRFIESAQKAKKIAKANGSADVGMDWNEDEDIMTEMY
ncbi:COP9 signalosome complex subunit 3 protein [Rutstroemia sp. NJR-2017a WRK4]|nr:COP9 signalosome complex subunit 3 protein [Rutstroemia sp. NJR-2017a WRK4]